MASLNKVMLIGRLTDNPEPPRTLPNSGSTVVKFRFAVGRSKKNQQTGQWENDPNPLYIDCEAFSRPDNKRNLVELITQYAKKGDSLYIEGRLQLDQWDDKNGGGKRSKHKVVVESIEFVGGKSGEDGGGSGGQAGGYNSGGAGVGNRGGANTGVGRPATNTRATSPPPADDGGYDHEGGGNTGGGGGDDIPF